VLNADDFARLRTNQRVAIEEAGRIRLDED
jgi:hypothetical protein